MHVGGVPSVEKVGLPGVLRTGGIKVGEVEAVCVVLHKVEVSG